jgi:hypothetical protein
MTAGMCSIALVARAVRSRCCRIWSSTKSSRGERPWILSNSRPS